MNTCENSGGMADRDLDQILAAANRELLERIETVIDPNPTLIAIMARRTPAAGSGSPRATSPASEARQTLAVLVIGIRSCTRELIRVAKRARDLARARVFDVEFAGTRALTRDLARTRTLARVLALALDRALTLDRAADLDRAHAHARDLNRDLNRVANLVRARALSDDLEPAFDRDRAHALDRDLDRALADACNLKRAIGGQQVDASGADLSDVTIGHLDDLEGVIWTSQTTWPPGIEAQVRASSRQILPGVYQVGRGNDPDRSALARV